MYIHRVASSVMPNQPKTPNRAMRVPEDLWAHAKRVSAERGETVTAVVVAALQRYVDRYGRGTK